MRAEEEEEEEEETFFLFLKNSIFLFCAVVVLCCVCKWLRSGVKVLKLWGNRRWRDFTGKEKSTLIYYFDSFGRKKKRVAPLPGIEPGSPA